MDQWTELADEADRDDQAAADAAEGERLRVALASSGPAEGDADWGPLSWAVRLDDIR